MEKNSLIEKNERLLNSHPKASISKQYHQELPVKEQVVFDRAMKNMHFRLLDEVSETCTDENGLRLRDWPLQDDENARSVKLEGDESGTPIIAGGNILGAPACPIQQATGSRLFTTRYKDPHQVVRDLLIDFIEEDNPRIVHCDDKRIIDRLVKLLWSEYQKMTRRFFTDHKKKVRSKYLSVLGYTTLGRTASIPEENSVKEKERLILAAKLVREKPNGDLDCSWWRTATIEELRYSEKVENQVNFVPDQQFKNSIAIRTVEALRGYKFAKGEKATAFHDETAILSISRCDAFITSSMNVMKNKHQPGGKTGKLYKDEYETLLPRATEELLVQCRNVINSKAPTDFKLVLDKDNDVMDTALFGERQCTNVFRMTHTKELYLAFTPDSFIIKYISRQVGKVQACYIGVAYDADKWFRSLGNQFVADRDTSDEEASMKEISVSDEDDAEDDDSTDSHGVDEDDQRIFFLDTSSKVQKLLLE